MNAQTLLIATANKNKIREMRELLGASAHLLSLSDIAPHLSLPEESGTTFEENASLKALYVGGETGMLTLSDDSGFEVVALNGEPGIYSARFFGGDPAFQRKEILKRMDGIQDRRCRFVCVLALFDPTSKKLSTFKGIVEGAVSHEERGNFGFGYDSIFIPDGKTQTFAELSADLKNEISHRARAVNELKKQWTSGHEERGASLQYLFDRVHPSKP